MEYQIGDRHILSIEKIRQLSHPQGGYSLLKEIHPTLRIYKRAWHVGAMGAQSRGQLNWIFKNSGEWRNIPKIKHKIWKCGSGGLRNNKVLAWVP